MSAFARSVASWRPRTPFYYGWLVLGMSAMGAFSATGVTQLVLGGIQTFILEDTGWDRSEIALAATMGTWAAGFLSPFVGRLADRYGPRGLMPIGAFIVGICFFAISEVHSIWQFHIAYFIARAIANPMLIGVVPRTVAVNFFQRKRNLAIGITAMARPVGGAINIQIISLIAVALSWRAAYQYMSLMALALVIPLYLIMRRRPEDIGILPDGDGPADSEAAHARAMRAASSSRRQAGASQFDWRAGEAALTTTFWFIVLAEASIILTAGAVNFQVVPYLIDSGLSRAIAAGALSLSSLLGAFANPLWGLLADRYSPKRLMLVVMLMAWLFASLFLVTRSGQAGFFVVIAWGTASGGLNVLGSMMMAHYFGRRSYGAITGLMGPIQTGALGLGPTFGAFLVELTGSYTPMFLSAMASYAVALVLIVATRQPRLPRRATAEGLAAQD